MKFSIGQSVISEEHPNAIGVIRRVTETGVAIEFQTPSSLNLPFGHAIIKCEGR
jgi:hypothetical protein